MVQSLSEPVRTRYANAVYRDPARHTRIVVVKQANPCVCVDSWFALGCRSAVEVTVTGVLSTGATLNERQLKWTTYSHHGTFRFLDDSYHFF